MAAIGKIDRIAGTDRRNFCFPANFGTFAGYSGRSKPVRASQNFTFTPTIARLLICPWGISTLST
jgi:hypothetical protein